MHVKANESLFNHWRNVGRVIMDLANIVQNDMDINIEDVEEWQSVALAAYEKVEWLVDDTLRHIYHDIHRPV